MELANEAVAASHQIGACFSFRYGIRKTGSANGTARAGHVSVRVGGFDCRSVNNETEQQ
jgi:hypothetical protein